MDDRRLQASGDRDCVEAELVSNGPGERAGRAGRPFGEPAAPPPPGLPGLLARLRNLAALAAGAGGVLLLLLGLLLTTTVIGAVLGIPLMLAGMALLALALRLAANSKGAFIFRKFP